MTRRNIRFTKMHGLGNDYIYINVDAYPIRDIARFAIEQSRRHFGIGGDGVVTYGRESDGLYRMRIYNADGSEGLMCGNAIRCIAKLLYEGDLYHESIIPVHTASGTKTLHLTMEHDTVVGVRVDMGCPDVQQPHLQVITPTHTYEGVQVSMGNPHFVTFLPEKIEDYPLASVGPSVEQHSIFPDRTNFEIAHLTSPSHITMRVYERGSGITLACGTGACATAVAAITRGIATSPVTVEMPGGALTIEWAGTAAAPVYMTGPATVAFEGEVYWEE